MKKVQLLASRLAGLHPGERSWFWFSPDSLELPLLLEAFSDAKGMERLLRRADSLALPAGARVCTGFCAVSESGILQFASPLLEAWMLTKLALWVHRNIAAVPELAYLRGAIFLRVDVNGAVTGRFADPELWEGLEVRHRPGTLEHAAQAIDGLQAGEDLWLWMVTRSDQPLIVVVPVGADPSGEQFASQVLAGRSRLGSAGTGLRGVARRLVGGSLLITTADDLDLVDAVLVRWLVARGEVRLACVRDGDVVSGRRLGGDASGMNFTDQVQALQAILSGATYVFWFTDQARGGGPLLLLESSPAALKPLAMEADIGAPSLRGEVVAARWGVEFRARRSFPDFIDALARWVIAHHSAAPGLRALIGARMTVRDKDGEIVERVKNDEAWAPLGALRS